MSTKGKKPTTLLAKLKAFYKDGADWQTKHYGVSDIIKVQVLPANKTNPKRLGLFITTQGRNGRKGVRLADNQMYIDVAEALTHDKTLEVIEAIEKINPKANSSVESISDDL